jgi:hypothetical protein
MKKIIAAIIISVSLISVSAHAQTSAHGKNGTEMKQMLKDSLHLTDVQTDSVMSIRQEFREKIKAVMQNSSISADQKKEQVKPLKEQMKTRLKAILTKEQMQKMQEMRKGGKMDDNNQ